MRRYQTFTLSMRRYLRVEEDRYNEVWMTILGPDRKEPYGRQRTIPASCMLDFIGFLYNLEYNVYECLSIETNWEIGSINIVDRKEIISECRYDHCLVGVHIDEVLKINNVGLTCHEVDRFVFHLRDIVKFCHGLFAGNWFDVCDICEYGVSKFLSSECSEYLQ